MELWHNPRCSKSRAAKALLDEAEATYVERRYLENPPTVDELDEVLQALGLEPWDLARDKEAREAGLTELPHDRQRWLEALVANPKAIQRPIVISDGRAVVGRPPEQVQRLLG